MAINFTKGDIFLSKSDYLVNTVNCEGYMGKGLAYQFKKRYPEMEKDYKKICELDQLKPGKLHFFKENGKTIINFPTKDKWRAKSKIEYIEQGLSTLKKEIIEKNILSIAIPPLGSGNGGLNWNLVKELITDSLEELSNKVVIEVFEPAESVENIKKEPESNFKTLCILYISERIEPPRLIKLKNALKLIEILSNKDIVIKNFDKETKIIANLKKYYHITSNEVLYSLIKTKLISDTIENLEKNFKPIADEAIRIVNKYDEQTVEYFISALNLVLSRKSNDLIKEIPPEALSNLFSEELLSQDIFENITINYMK
ncbi:macro domain-containing protein [Carnobacterium divergens]|uniref:macro domain-containing protein n=1 Tax=Carnobacterium divergens TaxID=2748 RepID=UPI0010723E4A|nr:macro domain-containing protein [Carnobacterium divergens]TFI72245.1 hypothetical protein CKN81_08865 [Carnobacterium divergens]